MLPDHVPERLLLLSGGSGITPVMSMLRTLHRRTHRGRITFLHYAQSPDHQIFAAELDEIRHSGHGTEVHLLHPSRRPEPVAGVPRPARPGLPRRAHLRLRPGADDRRRAGGTTAPACSAWSNFQPPRTRAPPPRATSPSSAPASRSRTPEPPCSSRPRQAGLTPEFGCRMGICLSCTAVKRDGTVRNVPTGEESSLPDEEIRVCVNAPVGDCVVDL